MENQKTTSDVVIRYAKRLVTHDIAKMSPISQNLMSYLFAIWTKTPNTETTIDLFDIKRELKIEHQSEKFINGVIAKTSKEIINKSFIDEEMTDGSRFIGYMIYQFYYDSTKQTLQVKTSPDFMNLFTNCDSQYVTYNFSVFLNIKSKQGKNLYRLFSRYHKGHFTLDWEEFKKWLGYKETAENRNVVYAIRKAIKYLLDRDYLKECEMSFAYSSGTGRKIKKVHFSYLLSKFPDSTKTILESSVSDNKAVEGIETRPYTKEDETALWDDFKPKELEPEAAITVATPPDFSKITAKSKNDVQLPTIADLPPLPPREPEPEPKPLEHHCPLCNKSMQIRQNKESGAYFWGCDRGHPTITLTPEEVRQYKNQKK